MRPLGSGAVLMTRGMQDAIQSCLRGQIASLVGQLRDDLARRQMRIGLAVAQREDTLSLKLAERVSWRGPDSGCAPISQYFLRKAPAL